jgi:hypothetical protein
MITWQNVETPRFKDTIDATTAANTQLAGILDPLKTMVTDAQKQEKTNFDAQAKLNTQKLIAVAQSSDSVDQLKNEFSMKNMIDSQGGAAMADFGAVLNAARDRKGVVADENTQKLYADVRNFTDINQLNTEFDPGVLQQKFGIGGYNQDMVDKQVKDRVGILRQEATDEVVANSPTFKTHAEISDYLNNGKFSNQNLDRKEVETALVNKLNGVQADTKAVWDKQSHDNSMQEHAQATALYNKNLNTDNAFSSLIPEVMAGGDFNKLITKAGSLPGVDTNKLIANLTSFQEARSKGTPQEQLDMERSVIKGSAEVDNNTLGFTQSIQDLTSTAAKVNPISAGTKKAIETYALTTDNPQKAIKDQLLAGADWGQSGAGDIDKAYKAAADRGLTLAQQHEVVLEAFTRTKASGAMWGSKTGSNFLQEATNLTTNTLKTVELSNSIEEMNKLKDQYTTMGKAAVIKNSLDFKGRMIQIGNDSQTASPLSDPGLDKLKTIIEKKDADVKAKLVELTTAQAKAALGNPSSNGGSSSVISTNPSTLTPEDLLKADLMSSLNKTGTTNQTNVLTPQIDQSRVTEIPAHTPLTVQAIIKDHRDRVRYGEEYMKQQGR